MISCYYEIFFFSFVGLNISFKIRRFQYLMSQHTVIKSNMKINLQRVGVEKVLLRRRKRISLCVSD